MKAFHAHCVPGQTSPIICFVSTMLRNRVSPSALACLLLLLIASPARGRYTLEQVMSSPFPSQLVAAKNGGGLAWVVHKRGGRKGCLRYGRRVNSSGSRQSPAPHLPTG